MFGRLWYWLLFTTTCLAGSSAAADKNVATERLALLVGCTEYPTAPLVDALNGPNNDIPMMARLLVEKFAFSDEQITRLFGWTKNGNQNPTRANIEQAFQNLALKARELTQAGKTVQVFILVSGHGMQVPTKDESEIDGLDEIFLAADVKPWNDSTVPNAIRDDEFGAWLAAIQDSGAHVWVVFDCCHSGTMMRGPTAEQRADERPRAVSASALKIPAEAFKDARLKREADASTADLTPDKKAAGRGSLVAFYAAQSFEETPELPRPKGAPREPANIYGLFSYTLTKTLQQHSGPLNYAQLSQMIVDTYRAERGTWDPTPSFAGDLDQQVLGSEKLAAEEFFLLQRTDSGLQLVGGQLHGLERGSVLAVYPPLGKPGAAAPFTHVRVATAGPLSATVEPCEFQGLTAAASEAIVAGSRCKLVFRDVGEMSVKLAVVTTPETERFEPLLIDAIKGSSQFASLESGSGNWLLHCLTPEQAKDLYGLTLGEPTALLVQQLAAETALTPPQPAPRVFAQYPLASFEAAGLQPQLQRDMQKIFTWQNFWRVAGRATTGKELGLRLEVDLLGPQGPQKFSVLKGNQRIQTQVWNDGPEPCWIGVYYLDRNLAIKEWTIGAMKPKASLKPKTATVNGSAPGCEGFVLLAYPQAQHKQEPNWKFLLQDPVGLQFRDVKPAAPDQPFARLMTGALQTSKLRGEAAQEEPVMLMRTWLIQ